MVSFQPAKGLTNPHLQTLFPRLYRRQPVITGFSQRLETPDDDFLDLMWSEDKSHRTAHSKPIFVLFHGLEGSFDSPYANGLMNAFAKQGWLSVMMHFRGCSGEMNRQARAYHSGETEDARFFLQWLQRQYSNRPIVAVGVSLGGNMLVNYLSKYADDPILDDACVISAPLDLKACTHRIEQGFSKVYRNYLLKSLKRNSLIKLPLLKDNLTINAQKIRSIKTIIEFDNLITAPLHGFHDAHHYYRTCSGLPKLSTITTPLTIIHAQDDPFMTDAVIPKSPLPKNIHYQLCQKGGHVGFVGGSIANPQFWLEQILPSKFEYLRT